MLQKEACYKKKRATKRSTIARASIVSQRRVAEAEENTHDGDALGAYFPRGQASHEMPSLPKKFS
jgi:hypothetical protein